jgi:hypothetical protein
MVNNNETDLELVASKVIHNVKLEGAELDFEKLERIREEWKGSYPNFVLSWRFKKI